MPESSSSSAHQSASSAGTPVHRYDRYADGSTRSSGFEIDGVLHGHWEWFRLDGTLMRSGEFSLGDQVGIWRTWDRSGRLVKETSFGAAPESGNNPAADSAADPATPASGTDSAADDAAVPDPR